MTLVLRKKYDSNRSLELISHIEEKRTKNPILDCGPRSSEKMITANNLSLNCHAGLEAK
jgi:hypothetical protein